MYMLSFNFILGLNFISLCFWVWQCMVMSLKQREIKFKPRIKLNHNIYIYRKQQHKKGLEPGTFSSTQLHLTTTPQKLITLPWGKKLYLFHETFADKMMRTTLTELLTVKKKQCERIFHGNERMKEHNYALQNADTRPRL